MIMCSVYVRSQSTHILLYEPAMMIKNVEKKKKKKTFLHSSNGYLTDWVSEKM